MTSGRLRGTKDMGLAAALAGVFCVSCAGPPSARDRLAASAEAIQRLESLAYEYSYEGSGSAAGSFTGGVRLVHPADGPVLYRAELRPSPSWDPAEAGDDPPPALILSGGGDHVAARDEALARFSHGTISGGSGHLVANAPFAVLSEFTEATPFDTELAGEFELVSQETVGGVLCDVLRGTTNEFGPARVWWHIGVEDDLPRAFRWEAEDGSGVLAFEIPHLEIDPPTSPDQLAIQVDLTGPDTEEVFEEDERALVPGVTAPDWRLPAPDGGSQRLSELRGEIVVLNFWSSWCIPCRDLAIEYDAVSRRLAGTGVRFLALNGWESPEVDPERTLREWGLDVPILLHAERIAVDYKLISPPALYVVDARGDLALVRNPAQGEPESEAGELERVIRSLLDGGG